MSSKEDLATIHVLTMYKCFDIDLNKTYQDRDKEILHSELVHFFIGSNDSNLTLKVIEKLGIKEKDKNSFLDKINSDIIKQGVQSYLNDYNRDAVVKVLQPVTQSGIEANGGGADNRKNRNNAKNRNNTNNTNNRNNRNKKQKGGVITEFLNKTENKTENKKRKTESKNTDLIQLLAENIKKTVKEQLSFIQGKTENNVIYTRLLSEITDYCNTIDVDFELDKFRLVIKTELNKLIDAGSQFSNPSELKNISVKDALTDILNKNLKDEYYKDNDDNELYKQTKFKYNNENVRIILKYIANSIIEDDSFNGIFITKYTCVFIQGLLQLTNTIIEVVEFVEVFTLPSLLINVIFKRDIADLYSLHYRLYKYNGLDISLISRCLLPLLNDIKIYNEEKVPFYRFNEIIASNTRGFDNKRNKRNNFMKMMKMILERFLTKLHNPIDNNKISILSTYFGCKLQLNTRSESKKYNYIDCISENILNIIIQMNKNSIGNFDNVLKYVEDDMIVEKNLIDNSINNTDEKSVAMEDIKNFLPCRYDDNEHDDEDSDSDNDEHDNNEKKINAYYSKIYYHIYFINENLINVHSRDSNSDSDSDSRIIEVQKEPIPILINGSMIFTSKDMKMIGQIKKIQTQFIYLYADYHRYICLLLYNNNNNNNNKFKIGHDGQSIIAFIKEPDVLLFKFEITILKETIDKLRYIECLYLFMRMYGIPIPTGDGIINYIHTRQSMFLITGESIDSWDHFHDNNAKIGEFTIANVGNTNNIDNAGNINNTNNIDNIVLNENILRLRTEILGKLEKLEKNSKKRAREGGGFKKRGGKKNNQADRMIKSFVRKELINRSMRDLYRIKGRGNTLFLDINGKKCVRYTNFMKEKKEKKEKKTMKEYKGK